MSQPVLVKAYGSLWPADEALAQSLGEILSRAVPPGAVELEGDLLRLSFEGVWLPAEEILEEIAKGLKLESKGRLDLIDIENWRLKRSEFLEGRVRSRSAPLNSVLDYSGH